MKGLIVACTLLFGSLMFVAGATAPAGVSGRIRQASDRLSSTLSGWLVASTQEPSGADGGTSPVVNEAQVPYSQLLRNPEPSKGAGYGIQVAMLARAADANALMLKLTASGYQGAVVHTLGPDVFVLIAGPYKSEGEALTQRRGMAAEPWATGVLPLLAWPATQVL